MRVSKGARITLLVILLLIIDQVIKILVKTNMTIGESIHVCGNWFQILFIENNGMAFGLQFGENWGKLMLSLCRLVLIVVIIIYMRRLLKKSDTPTGVLVGLAAILCGAIGNIIDSTFYGLIFSASGPDTISVLGGSYAPIFYGRVVDMVYFPLIDTTLPAGFPIWGGRHIVFFRPIFNFADSCITCGAIYLLLFQWKFFAKSEKKEPAGE